MIKVVGGTKCWMPFLNASLLWTGESFFSQMCFVVCFLVLSIRLASAFMFVDSELAAMLWKPSWTFNKCRDRKRSCSLLFWTEAIIYCIYCLFLYLGREHSGKEITRKALPFPCCLLYLVKQDSWGFCQSVFALPLCSASFVELTPHAVSGYMQHMFNRVLLSLLQSLL